VGTDTLDGIHHYVSSAEVRKVQEELKSRVMTLQALVTDPLPYALHVSGIVRSELEMRSLNHVSGEVGAANSSVEKDTEPDHSNNGNHGNLISSHRNDVPQPAGKENDAPNLFVDKVKGTEYVQSGDLNPGDPCCSNQNRVSRLGFLERNSNAHTYEVVMFTLLCSSLTSSFQVTTLHIGKLANIMRLLIYVLHLHLYMQIQLFILRQGNVKESQ
jgi:hypothetical protein